MGNGLHQRHISGIHCCQTTFRVGALVWKDGRRFDQRRTGTPSRGYVRHWTEPVADDDDRYSAITYTLVDRGIPGGMLDLPYEMIEPAWSKAPVFFA